MSKLGYLLLYTRLEPDYYARHEPPYGLVQDTIEKAIAVWKGNQWKAMPMHIWVVLDGKPLWTIPYEHQS